MAVSFRKDSEGSHDVVVIYENFYCLAWIKLHSCLVIFRNHFHYIYSVRQSCQSSSRAHDIFNLGQVFSLRKGLTACMSFDSSESSFLGKPFNQLEFIVVLRYRNVAFQGFIQIDMKLVLALFSQLRFSYGFNDFHPVDVYA